MKRFLILKKKAYSFIVFQFIGNQDTLQQMWVVRTIEKAGERKKTKRMKLFPDLRMSIAKFKNIHRERKHPHDMTSMVIMLFAGSVLLHHVPERL